MKMFHLSKKRFNRGKAGKKEQNNGLFPDKIISFLQKR
jgi:hypothetical protein